MASSACHRSQTIIIYYYAIATATTPSQRLQFIPLPLLNPYPPNIFFFFCIYYYYIMPMIPLRRPATAYRFTHILMIVIAKRKAAF